MRLVRFRTPGSEAVEVGTLDINGIFRPHPDGEARPLDWDAIMAMPPVHPHNFRDFQAFETHAKNMRARQGLEMTADWYHFPAFYYSSTAMLYGHDADVPYPAHTRELDYALEVACVIGEPGRNIKAEYAHDHIVGYTILNNWNARDLERAELKVGLGPAKAKDFATSLGPWLTTPDELADRTIGAGAELRYDLTMIARVNGHEFSRGNLKTLHYTFAQMIARASDNCWLNRGDVIGSGTVGNGCLLELGAIETLGRWLQPNDVVELEVERLGVLRNRIVAMAQRP
jgi:fumarylacetoacetate (FAA) hydrolase